eukprot:1484965-Rhodomonas_salina.1
MAKKYCPGKNGKTGEDSETGEQDAAQQDGPFQDQHRNEIWRVLASQMMENYNQLADIDMLEPNQANRKQVMKNERLRPFWIDSEGKELQGLWKWGCLKRWKRSDLETTDCVFGSRFHYNIKWDCKT